MALLRMVVMKNLVCNLVVVAVFSIGQSAAFAQQGDIRPVHDPCLAKHKGVYYLFSTGRGIPIRVSTDLVHWKLIGPAFKEIPGWTGAEVPGFRGYIWAPDISFFNGVFHLYYSVSTFGKNRSCIGLATNTTLDPASKDYHWTDQGKVIESTPGKDKWNAIDPNIVLDAGAAPWLSFGSFWSGIKIVRINPATGMPRLDTFAAIASRPGEGAVEAPFIIRKNDYYYLFVSFDHCCRGVRSDYKIMVGRSRNVSGPYLDRSGKRMTEGGGTLVLASIGACRGPGHNAVLTEGAKDWLIHHYYDADRRGVATLQVRPLLWADDNWPLAGEPISDQGHK
jgi:arabinan endo-1,5-alpha-L-arabinosidase